jgi:GNAT superfamily N-acetyltransferase
MVEIRLVKHSQDKEQLLDLFRASFGHSMPAELWDWKYIENPLAPPDPEVVVALDNGRIVGARPFRPVALWLGNKTARAALGSDVMVHPEHQRKGITTRMYQFGMEYLKENGYALHYGIANEKSHMLGLKQGHKTIATRESIFRPINPQKLFSHRLENKVVGTGVGFLYDNLLNIKPRDVFQPRASFGVKVFDQFNDELEEIDTLRDQSLIELVRSESYLRYRFDRRPGRDYRYIVAQKDETLWGYAVVSAEEQISGLVYGYIVDHIVRDRDIACFRALISRSLDELEKWRCDIASVWAPGEPLLRKELLKHLGFKSSLTFPYSRFSSHRYFTVRMTNEQATAGVNIYDKANWRVTYTYSDAV